MENTKKVTGIGGIFFKTKDAEKMKSWYNENLGLGDSNRDQIRSQREVKRPR